MQPRLQAKYQATVTQGAVTVGEKKIGASRAKRKRKMRMQRALLKTLESSSSTRIVLTRPTLEGMLHPVGKMPAQRRIAESETLKQLVSMKRKPKMLASHRMMDQST